MKKLIDIVKKNETNRECVRVVYVHIEVSHLNIQGLGIKWTLFLLLSSENGTFNIPNGSSKNSACTLSLSPNGVVGKRIHDVRLRGMVLK